MPIAYWRNHQVPDQCIDRGYRFRDTASISAIGDIQFCHYLLARQLNQAITMWQLTQNGLQFLLIVSPVTKLQLIYRPLLIILPITRS